MSDQPQTSASADAATVRLGPSSLTEEEKALIQWKNPKEAINYEVKIKKIVSGPLKHFQRGTNPDPGNVELDVVYPCMVQELKKLVSTAYDPVSKINHKAIIKTITNP